MKQPSYVRQVLARLVAAPIVVLALVACSKSDRRAAADKTSPNAAAAPAAAPAVAAVSAAPLGPGSAPGALSKPVDQMTGDELYTLAHQLRFTGGVERQRRCRGHVDCRGARPGRSTRLRVDAVDQEDSLSVGGLTANGIIAAKVINHGDMADTMYATRPGAQYENYLIVYKGAGENTGHWKLEELTTTAGSRSHRTLSSGTFRECGHPFVRGARADFKTCEQAAAPIRPASFGAAFQGDDESPIWIGCAFGCCTAGPPDGRG